MAETHHPAHPTGPAATGGDPEASARAFHDGRFGKTFDAEIDVKGVFWVAIGILVAAIAGMAITWVIYRVALDEGDGQDVVGTPTDLVAPTRLPEGPVLQMHPEEELVALREEMRHDLETWRWDDEAAGTVVLPIDVALEVVAAQGLPARAEVPVETALEAEPAEELAPALRAAPGTSTEATGEEPAAEEPAAEDPADEDSAGAGSGDGR